MCYVQKLESPEKKLERPVANKELSSVSKKVKIETPLSSSRKLGKRKLSQVSEVCGKAPKPLLVVFDSKDVIRC